MLKIKERMYNDSGKLVFGENMNELKEWCGHFPDRTERSEQTYCKNGDVVLYGKSADSSDAWRKK